MIERDYLERKLQLQKEIAFYAKHFPRVTEDRKRRLDSLEKEYKNE